MDRAETADYSEGVRMKRLRDLIAAAVLALAAGGAIARPAAIVEGVQMPAWLERAEPGAVKRIPLAPGMELRGGDELKTGAGARIYVKLAEGSLVQLGENATLRLQELSTERESLFKAALRVLEGAFRFTTDVVARERRREVSITLRSVTAGVRGTDLWGKSTEDHEIVCLIEGSIEVGAQGETPVTLNEPLQFYRREKGVTGPIARVGKEQLAEWARQTAIAPGAGAARRGGRFSVTAARAESQQEALAAYDRLRAAGYAAEIRPLKDGERFVYVVRIGQLASRADAEALAARLPR
jgi:hypothetical protein